MMKIALHNELPAEGQFRQLVESLSGQEGPAEVPGYETFCQCKRVIAAYDQGRLVAIGGVADACDCGVASGFRFTVVPDYRSREIDAYMKKAADGSRRFLNRLP
ncbi:hypothetical protein LJK87_48330 [Paenibacillus sp. P25]|nr:hypothetical protein LJK87_48330 [Paenibacillus sp. P25]